MLGLKLNHVSKKGAQITRLSITFRSAQSGEFSMELTHLPLDKMAAILADDIFKRIFLNENVRILIQISLKFVPKGSIDNKPALV